MSQFNVAMLFTAETRQAQAAIGATRGELERVGPAGATAGRQVAAGADQATAATQRQTAATGGLARAQRTLTQQLLQTLGAGRALRAIGPALLGVLSPMNVLTFGAAALGAALADSLFGGGKAAKSLADQLKEAESAADAMRTAAARGSAALRKEFGAVTPEVLRMNEALKALAARTAMLDAQEAAKQLSGLGNQRWSPVSRQARLAGLFGGTYTGADGQSAIMPEITAVDRSLRQLGRGGPAEDQLRLVRQIRQELETLAGGWDNVTAEQREILEPLLQYEQTLERIRASEAGVGSARAEANASLRERIAVMEAENEVARLTLEYGRDSAQVAFARAVEERRVLEAMLATSDASEEVKDELRRAFDEGQRLAQLDMAGGIRAAAGAAEALAARLGVSLAVANQLRGLGLDKAAEAEGDGRGSQRAGRQDAIRFRTEERMRELEKLWRDRGIPGYAKVGAGTSGSGASAAGPEASAVAELRDRLRGELDVLREADPVRREMLRLRQELTAATPKERAEVEALVTTLERERQSIEALNFVSEAMGDALIDALMGGKDAGEQLIRTLARAVAQAALLGQGPLASLFGGVGLFGSTPQGGGILGAILGGLVQRRAGGGLVTGPGGPTDDRIPALLSNGEFVVRAAAVARNRALLEAINGGGPPRFAQGGFVGTGGGAGPGGGLPPSGTVRIALDPGLRAEIREAARADAIEIVRAGLTSYDRETLPDRVADINRDPRRRD